MAIGPETVKARISLGLKKVESSIDKEIEKTDSTTINLDLSVFSLTVPQMRVLAERYTNLGWICDWSWGIKEVTFRLKIYPTE